MMSDVEAPWQSVAAEHLFTQNSELINVIIDK
ncbi:Uncharacterised protein [Escherichia coli]|uniref:Uncharacterized protein n=1 Tax=Escherichia coli TaxID=562 RepID=A0A2X1Q9N5_ECOLX|nr:Uncharacterised protein [Escherichia coli]